MSSLRKRIDDLEADLKHDPIRISVYHDLPFAIFRYEPGDEWEMRREVKNLETRLANSGKRVVELSLESMLWDALRAIEEEDLDDGYHALVDLEKHEGFLAAQEVLITYLSSKEWCSLAEIVARRLNALDPARDIAFLLHAAAMAPDFYQMSRLLDELHGRTMVPAILYYPGTLEGTTGLRFMDLRNREATGNYRVKIY